MTRAWIGVVIAAGVVAAAAGPFQKKLDRERRVEHALNRLTFGARPGDADRVKRMGVEKWVELQLHPERIAENPGLGERLASLRTLTMTSEEIAKEFPRKAAGEAKGPRPVVTVARELTAAKVQRALLSERQLEELLVDFWFNHFNVYLNKGVDRYLVTSYERDAIRPHVLGKFKDMLLATARHPAMLWYLDNWQSMDPKAADRLAQMPRMKQFAKKGGKGLNENYGRELLELHTLGVDGGYTQEDVIAVARCFTGWTLRRPQAGGGYQFVAAMHDRGEKTVLGHRIAAGGGESDGVQVIEMLARHPATARFVSRKLAQRFVADDPPEALVARMAETFRKTDGDLRAVTRTMVMSGEFWSEGAYRAKVKTPLELVVSAARAVGAEVQRPLVLAREIEQLGEPLYRKEEPTGYSWRNEEWVSTSGLLGRMNFGSALAAGKVPGVAVEGARWEGKAPVEVARAVLGKAPVAETVRAIADGGEWRRVAGVVLGSPEFQRR